MGTRFKFTSAFSFVCAVTAVVLLSRPISALAQTDIPDWSKMGPPNRINELYGAGRIAEAIPLAEDQLKTAEKRFGVNHPETRSAIQQLATLQFARGNKEEAISLGRRHLAISEAAFGLRHPQTTESQQLLLSLLIGAGKKEEAAALLKDLSK